MFQTSVLKTLKKKKTEEKKKKLLEGKAVKLLDVFFPAAAASS